MIPNHFQNLLEQSLRFTWLEGAVTPVYPGFNSGTRLFPFAVVTQIVDGEAELHAARNVRYRDGEAMLVPAGIRHHFTVEESHSSESRARWAHFQITLFDSIDVLQLIEVPWKLSREVAAPVGDFCEALAEIGNEPPGIVPACRRQQLGFQMVTHLLEAARPRNNLDDLLGGIVRLTPVLEFLQEHYAENVTRENLAKIVNLSPTHFHSVFNQIMGIAPMRYLQHYRIAKAQQLLISTALGISEIAFQTGFADPLYFSRAFKSRTGESPQNYRVTSRKRPSFA